MDKMPLVQLLRVRSEQDRDIPLPTYMTSLSAGLDLRAAILTRLTIAAGDIALVPTGFAMEIPCGLEAQIRPRSGLAVKYGLTVVNSPGTIDADYRGEIQVALINLGKQPCLISRGDRIAQMVIQPVCRARLTEVAALSPTDRGDGGFGHTGV